MVLNIISFASCFRIHTHYYRTQFPEHLNEEFLSFILHFMCGVCSMLTVYSINIDFIVNVFSSNSRWGFAMDFLEILKYVCVHDVRRELNNNMIFSVFDSTLFQYKFTLFVPVYRGILRTLIWRTLRTLHRISVYVICA